MPVIYITSMRHQYRQIFGSLSATTISPDHDQEQESHYLFMLMGACDHICAANRVLAKEFSATTEGQLLECN